MRLKIVAKSPKTVCSSPSRSPCCTPLEARSILYKLSINWNGTRPTNTAWEGYNASSSTLVYMPSNYVGILCSDAILAWMTPYFRIDFEAILSFGHCKLVRKVGINLRLSTLSLPEYYCTFPPNNSKSCSLQQITSSHISHLVILSQTSSMVTEAPIAINSHVWILSISECLSHSEA